MAAARNVSAAASMTAVAGRLEIIGQLGGAGGLAGAVDADDEDRLGLGGQRPDRLGRAGQERHDGRAGDLGHILGGDALAARLQGLDDFQRQRHAEIGADERFLKLVPIHRAAGELLDEILEKTDSHEGNLHR